TGQSARREKGEAIAENHREDREANARIRGATRRTQATASWLFGGLLTFRRTRDRRERRNPAPSRESARIVPESHHGPLPYLFSATDGCRSFSPLAVSRPIWPAPSTVPGNRAIPLSPARADTPPREPGRRANKRECIHTLPARSDYP